MLQGSRNGPFHSPGSAGACLPALVLLQRWVGWFFFIVGAYGPRTLLACSFISVSLISEWGRGP